MTPLIATAIFGFVTNPLAWVVIAIIGVMLFGRRLPEIGRSLGKTIVEFKKGMTGLEDELDGAMKAPVAPQQQTAPDQIRPPQRVATTAPKFEDAPASSSSPQA